MRSRASLARMPVFILIGIIVSSTPLASDTFPSFQSSVAASPISPPTLNTAAINASMRQVLTWSESRVHPNGTATLQGIEQSLGNIPSWKNFDLPTTRNRQLNDQDNYPEHDQGRTHSASESVLYQLRNMVPCKPQCTIPSAPRRTEVPVKNLWANAGPDRKVRPDQRYPEYASQPAHQKHLFRHGRLDPLECCLVRTL